MQTPQHDVGADVTPELAASLEPALRDVVLRYPLPAATSGFDVFSEVIEINELRVHAFGISTTTEALGVVAGSAAELRRAPRERAYFELLERAVIMESRGLRERSDADEDSEHARNKLSLSNGVALHSTWRDATRSAALEIVERDRVLRSWYGGARPERISTNLGSWSVRLSGEYELSVVRFRVGVDLVDERATVVGIIAFPRSSHAPLSMGFAARGSVDEALQAASRELLQQIAFGWGEPVPSESPVAAPTPEFHLDFYAYPGHHALLRDWLDGKHEGRGPALPEVAGAFRFTDITPSWMSKELCVVRAEHPSAVPLVFGLGHPWFPELPECMRVQPVA